MQFSDALIATARSYVGCKEDFGRANRSECVDEFSRKFGIGLGNYWCAIFVSVVIAEAAEKIGIKPPIPKTSSAIAFTKMPNVKIDKTPAAGSVFYYKPPPTKKGTGDTTGHVGIVVKVLDDGRIETIEGNTGNAVKNLARSKADVARMQFIHIENQSVVSPNGGNNKNSDVATVQYYKFSDFT